jgi:hypothetical protein
MNENPAPEIVKRKAPWRGRKRVTDAKDKIIMVRCTNVQHASIEQSAAEAGYKVASYLRTLALGSPGPRAMRQAPVDTEKLAHLLGEIGKLGSNVNQIARYCNTAKQPADARMLSLMQTDIAAMRGAVMEALGRGD